SILLPSLNRARETANRVKCASNLRQIGLALQMYSNDNNGNYPRTNYVPDEALTVTNAGFDQSLSFSAGVGNNNIPAAIFLLMKTQEIGSEVFTCPSSGAEKDTFGGGINTAQNRSNFTDIRKNLSYSY